MSILMITKVWEREFDHADQIVMTMLANFADDNGDHVFPGLERIAWLTGYSVRQVQRIINGLVRKKALVVVRRATRTRPTEYRIDLDPIPMKPRYVPPSRRSPDILSPNGAGLSPDISARLTDIIDLLPDTAMSPDPSLDPSKKPLVNGAADAARRDFHFESLAEVCKLAPPDRNWSALAPTLRGPLNKYAKELRGMGAAPADIAAFGPWWYANDWRGLKNPPQPPSPADVVKEWPRFLNARRQPPVEELPERIRLAQAELRNFRGPNE